MKEIIGAFSEVPEIFYTVIPDSDRDTEIGPFRTFKKANNFAAWRFSGQADICAYSKMHLKKSEKIEIGTEEYARIMRDPKAHGLLVDPATIRM
jgi:hypothetical protein